MRCCSFSFKFLYKSLMLATTAHMFLFSDSAFADTIFNNTTPSVAVSSDQNSVELGLKFRSSVNGQIKAVRFYRGSENANGYVVNLWSSSGKRLATKSRRARSIGAGWREVYFKTPISIQANTTYIASYFTSGGGYAYENRGLATSRSSGALVALASSATGGNGVYAYRSTSGFPNQTYEDSHYYVDVVFEPATVTVAPSATLAASPVSIFSGSSSTLSWSSSNASTCVGVGFSTNQASSGSVTVAPLNTTTYSVNCDGAVTSVTVNVQAVASPTATLSLSPTSITAGQSATLVWNSANASSCVGNGFSTSSSTSGSVLVSPTSSTSYSINCGGAIANAQLNVSPVVTSPPPPPLVTSTIPLPGPNASLFKSNPYYTCVNNRYVATATNGGSDSNNGLQAINVGGGQGPYLTLQKAIDSLPSSAPGYCINIGDGVYGASNIRVSKGGNLAETTGFLVIRSQNLLGAKFSSSSGNVFNVTAPYVIFDGIEISGNLGTSSAHGIDTCFNGPNYNGIHHLIVMNSYIHQMGGNGIGTCWAEYYWILHNRLDQNAYNSWNSGVSTYQPMVIPSYTATAYDKRWTPYHNVYAYNRMDGNFTRPAGGPHTDGNGLIYDDTQHQQSAPNIVYTPMALILGNVSANNGGAGFQIGPASANADVFNNTAYNNYLDTVNTGTWRGSISCSFCFGVTFKNNLGIGVKGAGILSNNSPFISGNPQSANQFSNNLSFGGSPVMYAPDTFSSVTNLLNINPIVVNLSGSNFSLCTGVGVPNTSCSAASPAVGNGAVVPYWHQQTPGSVDIGACPAGVDVCP